MHPDNEESEYSFLFMVLAEKHNAVIRKIRELPPWEWGGEFLELEPQVLRFLGTFAKRYPECVAFKTAYTLASALARLSPRIPQAAISRRATERATDKPTDQTVMYQSVLARGARHSAPKQGRRSAPEEQHTDQDKCRGNDIPDKVHPMDALTATTKPGVFVLDIKTILALHITNQPRQKSKLAPKVRHSVPKHQPTGNRTRKRRTDGLKQNHRVLYH